MAELPSAMELLTKLSTAGAHEAFAAIERDRAQVREAALRSIASLSYKWRSQAMHTEEAPVECDESAKVCREHAAELDAAIRSLIGQPSQPDNATPHPQK